MKKLTGYASIDNPQNIGSTYFERNPIIPNANIYTVFKLLSLSYLDDPAVNCIDLNANYRQLIDDSVTISLALKELGVKKGDIISICMPNYYQVLAAFFACNRIGATVTILNSFAPNEEINEYLNEFEAPILINFDKTIEENEKIKQQTKLRYIITLKKEKINSLDLKENYSITKNDAILSYNSLASLAKYRKCKIEPPHSKKEDALILFTSGSTGKPKSVVLTNENIMAAEIYAKNTSHTQNIRLDKTLTCVPFSYPYGFVTSALTSLLWGKETILAPDIGKDTISYYYSKKPNMVFGSPALLDLTMNNIPINQDLSSVTHFVSGGDFLTAEHAQRGYEFFSSHGAKEVEVGNGSGNAETVSIQSTPVGVPLRTDTAGKLLVGTKVMIVDPDTFEEKKYGEDGLLCVAGKHIFKEYYNQPDLTSECKFKRGKITYYKTGTIGNIDEQGYFKLTARQSRFYIMSSLNKVYCDNVQNIISTYEYVEDCAVVKVPDKDQLYVNKAYIILKPEYKELPEIEEVINRQFYHPSKNINGNIVQLKQYEIPAYIEFVDELPRKQGTDKINYELLEKDAVEKLSKSKRLMLRK